MGASLLLSRSTRCSVFRAEQRFRAPSRTVHPYVLFFTAGKPLQLKTTRKRTIPFVNVAVCFRLDEPSMEAAQICPKYVLACCAGHLPPNGFVGPTRVDENPLLSWHGLTEEILPCGALGYGSAMMKKRVSICQIGLLGQMNWPANSFRS